MPYFMQTRSHINVVDALWGPFCLILYDAGAMLGAEFVRNILRNVSCNEKSNIVQPY